MKRSWVLGLCLSALLLSCTSKRETLVSQGNREQVLHFGNGAEPQGVDPHLVSGVPEHHIQLALFEGLVNYDPKDLRPVPGVARSWDVSRNGRVYTFEIRKNAKWSNGDTISARDFVFSWNRALSPKLGAEYAYMLYPVKNAKKFHTGKLSDFSKVGR